MKVFVWALGVTCIKRQGQPAPLDSAPIIVSNHFGILEGAVLLSDFRATGMTAVENTRIPFLGSIIKALDCVVVDRTGSATATGDAAETLRRRAVGQDVDAVGSRTQIVVFPEGTTTNQTSVISFKRGAFAPLRPVQPVACRLVVKDPACHLFLPWHAHSAWDPAWDPAWVNEGPSYPMILLRMMASWSTEMHVHFLPVLKPALSVEHCANAGYHSDVERFARTAQECIAAALGVPSTQFSFEDSWLGQRALGMGWKTPSFFLLEWGTFRKHFPLWNRDWALVRLCFFDKNNVLMKETLLTVCRLRWALLYAEMFAAFCAS
jgi:hypothetical protein